MRATTSKMVSMLPTADQLHDYQECLETGVPPPPAFHCGVLIPASHTNGDHVKSTHSSQYCCCSHGCKPPPPYFLEQRGADSSHAELQHRDPDLCLIEYGQEHGQIFRTGGYVMTSSAAVDDFTSQSQQQQQQHQHQHPQQVTASTSHSLIRVNSADYAALSPPISPASLMATLFKNLWTSSPSPSIISSTSPVSTATTSMTRNVSHGGGRSIGDIVTQQPQFTVGFADVSVGRVGETMRGCVEVNVHSDGSGGTFLALQALRVVLTCSETVAWATTSVESADATVPSQPAPTHVADKTTRCLYSASRTLGNHGHRDSFHRLTSGRHVFVFEFTLPTDLPHTTHTIQGSVAYYLHVTATTAVSTQLLESKAVLVHPPYEHGHDRLRSMMSLHVDRLWEPSSNILDMYHDIYRCRFIVTASCTRNLVPDSAIDVTVDVLPDNGHPLRCQIYSCEVLLLQQIKATSGCCLTLAPKIVTKTSWTASQHRYQASQQQQQQQQQQNQQRQDQVKSVVPIKHLASSPGLMNRAQMQLLMPPIFRGVGFSVTGSMFSVVHFLKVIIRIAPSDAEYAKHGRQAGLESTTVTFPVRVYGAPTVGCDVLLDGFDQVDGEELPRY
ncbi:hypothetical protein GQ42DRAFT_161848, partial [Ramicandelaber brevisporus]